MKYTKYLDMYLPEESDAVKVVHINDNFDVVDIVLEEFDGKIKNLEQSGGGASGEQLKWQHLTTLEFEEEAQQFLSDKYDESEGIKGVFIKSFIPTASDAVNFMIRLFDAANNEVVRVQPQGYVSTTDNTYGQAKLELVNGLWDGWWTAAVKADNNAWTAKYGLRYMDAGKTEADLPFVGRIIIGTSNEKVLPVGTKIEVWVLKNG